MGRQKIINELRLAELQKESEEVVNYLKVEKSINYFRPNLKKFFYDENSS